VSGVGWGRRQKYTQGTMKEMMNERMMMMMMMMMMTMMSMTMKVMREREREMERIDVIFADRVGYVAKELECDVQLVLPLPLEHVPNCIDMRHRLDNV
jgi:hypothetical protein